MVRHPERQSLGMTNHWQDRKSTRLNSSHSQISYAVFCLKKKTHSSYRLGSGTARPLWHAPAVQVGARPPLTRRALVPLSHRPLKVHTSSSTVLAYELRLQ